MAARHSADARIFKKDGGLTALDTGVASHEHLCKMLQTALTVDQFDGANLATAELICREIQMIEEKGAEKHPTPDICGEDSQYFVKTTTGRGSACACAWSSASGSPSG